MGGNYKGKGRLYKGAYRLNQDTVIDLAFAAGVSTRVALPADNDADNVARVFRVCATHACRIVFGGETIAATATSIYLPPDRPESFVAKGAQYVAAWGTVAPGNLSISEVDR